MPWLTEDGTEHVCDTPDSWYALNEMPKLGSLYACGYCGTLWRLSGWTRVPLTGDDEWYSEKAALRFRRVCTDETL